MKTVVIANQKGGVGKTAVACHMAFHLRDQGHRVLFADLDPQGNASSTLAGADKIAEASELFTEGYQVPESQSPLCLIAAGSGLTDLERSDPQVISHFRNAIRTAPACYDVLVIDTGPTMGLKMTAALIVADYVLSPIELESYSIQGITQMLQTVFGVKKKYNPGLEFLGMLPNRFNAVSATQKENFNNLMSNYAHLILAGKINNRSSIGEALGAGVPVWEIPKTSARVAAGEIREVMAIVETKMGLSNATPTNAEEPQNVA